MSKNKAIFLDRDGTLNIEVDYLKSPNELKLYPDVKETLKKLKKMGYLLIIITNQSGIARGYLTIEKLNNIHKALNELCDNTIDDFFFCPHHPDITGPCTCRKPEPGLILKALKKYNIDKNKSFMIGDKYTDVLSGINAKLKNSYLILTGYGKNEILNIKDKNISTLKNLSNILAFL